MPSCLRRVGAQADAVARSVADAEAEADGIRGIGLGYLPWYCGHLRVGKTAGDAVPVVMRPAPGLVEADAAEGFAHTVFDAAEAALIEAARTQGIAMLGMANAYACGVLGYFTARLAWQGLVALMFADASATMAPRGGRTAFVGTNPWSMAAPRDGAPLILESSASATAFVNLATAPSGASPSPSTGRSRRTAARPPTRKVALRGTIAPAGGHKGSALALMVEVLAARLTGANWFHEPSSLGDDLGGPPRLGQTIVAIRPGRDRFAGHVEGLLSHMAAEPGVRIPGDRRQAHCRRAEADGVAVDADLRARLDALSAGT